MSASPAWQRVDRGAVRRAVVVGFLHALVVLGIRSMLSVLPTPIFDLYLAWAVPGLTLVGGVAAYAFYRYRLVTPPLGLAIGFGWVLVRQADYRRTLGELAWTTIEPLSFYTTYWPLPLLLVLALAALEWFARNALPTRVP